MEALATVASDDYVDVDHTFTAEVDDDYASQSSGISRKSFCAKYYEWIQYCATRREKVIVAHLYF